MALKWRFSGGILFSTALHVFLLSALIYWYPGIISKNGWQWDEWSPFFANETASSGARFNNSTVRQKSFQRNVDISGYSFFRAVEKSARDN